MFRDWLAFVFRKLNTNLLYNKSWTVEKLLKITFLISTQFYKRWKKKARISKRVVIIVDRDIKMMVDRSKAMGAAFYWMGFHELNGWRFLHQHLKPDMVFLDVGANQGEFTLFSSKRLTHGFVLAFEPVDFFYQQLNENIQRNGLGNVKTFPFGLSDTFRKTPIYMGGLGAGEHEGLATIFESGQRRRFIQQVELKVFDEVASELALHRIDFMKIDVEGAELSVLNGSRRSIAHFRPWVMLEISDLTFHAAGYDVNDIIEFFAALNYSLNIISKGGVLERVTSIPSYCNVIFTPN